MVLEYDFSKSPRNFCHTLALFLFYDCVLLGLEESVTIFSPLLVFGGAPIADFF